MVCLAQRNTYNSVQVQKQKARASDSHVTTAAWVSAAGKPVSSTESHPQAQFHMGKDK